MDEEFDYDVFIIGAGPAGTTAAALLNQSGLRVLIVEKCQFPRFVIGESLLPQCMDFLDEAKFLDAVKARNYQRKNGANMFMGPKASTFDFGDQFTPGWDHTYQVMRGDFDQVLADTVQKAGVEVLFQHELINVAFQSTGVQTKIKDCKGNKREIKARFILDASGYSRVLSNLLDLNTPSSLPFRSSIFAHMKEPLRDSKEGAWIDFEKIWICIHPKRTDVWYWVIPFANKTASVGVVGPPDFFEENSTEANHKTFISTVKQEPHIKERFSEFDLQFSPKKIDGYSTSSRKLYGPNFAILGHAGAFLDPIFSSGIALSLKAAVLASKVLIRELKNEAHDWQKEFEEPFMEGVNTFKTYIEAWYDGSFQKAIFYPQKSPQIKKRICSILAGYVWDKNNPFVAQHEKRLNTLIDLCTETKK